jgi:hypothetical protein
MINLEGESLALFNRSFEVASHFDGSSRLRCTEYQGSVLEPSVTGRLELWPSIELADMNANPRRLMLSNGLLILTAIVASSRSVLGRCCPISRRIYEISMHTKSDFLTRGP